jgi:hypothetical protein
LKCSNKLLLEDADEVMAGPTKERVGFLISSFFDRCSGRGNQRKRRRRKCESKVCQSESERPKVNRTPATAVKETPVPRGLSHRSDSEQHQPTQMRVIDSRWMRV